MKQEQYLIVGANFVNKGAEAMMKTIRLQILQRNPGASVHAICHPLERELAEKQGIHPVYDTTSPAIWKLKSLVSRVVNKLGRVLGQPPKPFADYSPMKEIRKLTRLKMAVDVSGFAYGDKRGYIQPLETQKIIDFCKSVGARYIFMPQAWGDFKDARVAANCKRMLGGADAWFTRDMVSRQYVSNLLGKPLAEVPMLPDIAFHFPIPEASGLPILLEHGFPANNEREVVCISPNMRIYERMSGVLSENAYVRIFAGLIGKLAERFEVVLIPNEILPYPSSVRDDQFLCKTIYQALSSRDHVTCVTGYYGAEEIKSVIKECQLMIASRFHSLVFALSLGIPSLAVSWSHKYKELFRLFGLEEYVLEDTDIREESIMAAFEKLYEEKEAVSARILHRLPELKSESAPAFDLLS